MNEQENTGEQSKTMMYETDVTLLPDSVRNAIKVLEQEFQMHTDYIHVQLTYDNLRNPMKCEPRLHVIVDKVM